MGRRVSPVAFALGFGLALGACNALTGAGDLEARDCPECDPSVPPGPLAEGGAEGAAADGASPVDSPAGDVVEIPQPGGFLDKSFGTDGLVLSTLLDTVTSVAVQADGKLIVAGASGGQLAVARFGTNGAPDLSFGGNGRISAGTLTSSRAESVAIDSLGRIIAVGQATEVDLVGGPATRFAYLVRMNETGLDPTFAQAGRKTFTTDGEALTSVATAATNELYLGGRAPGNSATLGAIWRLSPAGAQLGARFDVDYAGGASTINAMSATPSSLVVVGNASGSGSGDFGVARVSSSGYDSSFDGDGKSATAVGTSTDQALAVGRLPDGSIVVGGEVQVGGGLGLFVRSPQFGLIKLKSGGGLETTWGTGGKAVVDFELPGTVFQQAGDNLRGLVVDAKGRVIAVGYADEKSQGPRKYRVVTMRLGTDGKLDTLYGTGGRLSFLFDPTETESRPSAVALQGDGKLIVVGTSSGQLGMARITP